MLQRDQAYLLLEVFVLSAVILLYYDRIRWKELATSSFLGRFALLFVVWICVDRLALSLGIWGFPDGGTLPLRIVGIPLEEYVLFALHTFVTFTVCNLVSGE